MKVGLIALALGLAVARAAAAGTVALTFDDLPIFGPHVSAPEAEDITRRLLGGLKRHHLKAIGFVNEFQLATPDREIRIGLLRQWLDASMDLGNHSYSHKSLTSTPVEAYIADVARGETVTKALLAARGRKEIWYRYPYLETGTTYAVRARFEGWLKQHGYRVAPVTMENSDWQFAEPYAAALLKGDHAQAAHIRAAYLAYTKAIIPWYRLAGRALLGREPAFVLLLHASRLNADSMDEIAALLAENDLRSVTLAKAMKDPAYRIADTYVGPDGDEWLTRWSLTLHRDLPYGQLPQVPADIVALDDAYEKAEAAAKPATP